MPQATLLGYLVPLQPRPVAPLKTSAVETRPSTVPSTSVLPTTIIDVTPVTSSVAEQEKSVLSNASIRTMINPKIFTDDGLNFFVPTSQPQAAVVKVLSSHIARLKNITSTLLPVRYPDRFFNECLDDQVVGDLSRVLLWNSQPVGWIRCRLETDDHGFKQIYVQVIGILAPYRGCGLAKNLLDQVARPSNIQKYGLTSIYCHVWESNEDAIGWYEKCDFKRVMLLEHYYRRLKPAGAWIMRKNLP